MPGFGLSPNDIPLLSEDYKNIISIFLELINKKPTMVFGHSFGGKVATLLNPPHLVLLSSAGIPVEKSLKTKAKIRIAKTLKPLLGKGVKNILASEDAKGMNSGMYQTFKNVVDEDFTEIFANFSGKATIFWGKSDSATPLACGERIAELMKCDRFFPLEGDHYFFLDKGKKIEQQIT